MALDDLFNTNNVTPTVPARLSTPSPSGETRWTGDPLLEWQMNQYIAQPPSEPDKPQYASTVTTKLSPYPTQDSTAPAAYMNQWKQNALYNQTAKEQYAQAGSIFKDAMKSYDAGVSNIAKTSGLGLSAYGFSGKTGMNSQRGSSPYGFQPQMWNALQSAFSAMKAAGLGTPGITDGWRSYAAQVAVKKAKPTLAATPGRSIHGLGLAADLNLTSSQQKWLNANGGKYGLVRLQSEPWHWALQPKLWTGKW